MSDKPVVKRATEQRYQWPPPQDESFNCEPADRNPIHSVLTALPILMLVVGLYFYYRAESEQNEGIPILSQSQILQGQFTGLSVVPSGSTSQHYFWLENNGKIKGLRVKPNEADKLASLAIGTTVQVQAAPTVEGSKKLWIWQLVVDSTVLINNKP